MSSSGEQVADALGVLLQRDVRQRVYARLTDGLGEGVNETTYPVLSGLERRGPSTAKELAAVVGLDRSVVSRHASTLERAGHLTRASDPRDPRWTRLSLTPAGQDVVTVMRARLTDLLDGFLQKWEPAAREQFAAMLTALTHSGPFSA